MAQEGGRPVSEAESIPLDLAVEAITNGLLRAVEAQSEVSGFAFDGPLLAGGILDVGNQTQLGVAVRRSVYPPPGSAGPAQNIQKRAH